MSNHRKALKAELRAAGAFKRRPAIVYLKTLVLLVLTAAFFGTLFVVDSWWLKVPAFVCGIATSIGLVMIAHDSGHDAISRNKFINDLPGWLLFPLFGGLSMTYWRYKHNTLHHAHTNVVGMDPDVAIFPFAMNRDQRAPKPGFARLVQRNQAVWFWPMTLFTTFAMRFDGLHFHLTEARKICSPQARLIDLACLTGHVLLWLVVPPLVFGAPWLATIAFYVAWGAVGGSILAAIFLPAHVTRPLLSSYTDNFMLQLQTTQNLKTNRLFSFLLVGLDHQVEHHLFQGMSHLNVKKAARVTRAYCERNGLPYLEQGWAAALVDCTKRIGELPDVDASPQASISSGDSSVVPAV